MFSTSLRKVGLPRPRTFRSLAGAACLAVLAGLAVSPPAANAATYYSAPERTAVRQLVVAAENNSGYDRTRYFGSWIDANHDCQNTRAEVLIAESRTRPRLSSTGCTVTTGTWKSIYDNITYTSASQVDIDHLVPVAEAWGSGARYWTQAKRVAFYNDLGDGRALNAIRSSLNYSKGARSPDQWMPPTNRCIYIYMWIAVKIRWRLTADSAEKAFLVRWANACPNWTITTYRM